MPKMIGYTRSPKKTYPAKTLMNLYYKEDFTTKISTMLLYLLFAFVVLLAIAKFAFFDVRQEYVQASEDLTAAQTELDTITRSLTNYNQVEKQYTIYSNGCLSEEETAFADRMDIMNLVEDKLMSKADISSLIVSGNTVTIDFTGVTLNEVAVIVRDLQSSPLVENVTVNTAASDSNQLTVNMVITVTKEGGNGG